MADLVPLLLALMRANEHLQSMLKQQFLSDIRAEVAASASE